MIAISRAEITKIQAEFRGNVLTGSTGIQSLLHFLLVGNPYFGVLLE